MDFRSRSNSLRFQRPQEFARSTRDRLRLSLLMVDHGQLPRSDRGRSLLSRYRIISWRKRYGLPASMIVTIPRAEERAQFPPPGYFAISDTCFKAGFRLPPSEEAVEIITYCGVPITQFSYNGLMRIMGLVCFFRECQMRLTVTLFRELCEVFMNHGEKVGVRSNKQWLKFHEKPDYRHGGKLFGFVENQWNLPEAQRLALPEHCRRLTGLENAPITCFRYDDTRTLARALHYIHTYVDVQKLCAVGLSLHPDGNKSFPLSRGKKRSRDLAESTREDSDEAPLVIVDGVKVVEAIAGVEETNVGKVSESPSDLPYSEENAGFGRAMAQCARVCSSMKMFNHKCGEIFEAGNTWNGLYVTLKDSWAGMQKTLEDFHQDLAKMSARNWHGAAHAQRIKDDLLEARARLAKAEKELSEVRLHVASIEGDLAEARLKTTTIGEGLLNALGSLKEAETEMACWGEETKAPSARISELPISQEEADKIKVAAVESYKESFEFLDERARYGEEIRAKVLAEEAARTLEECVESFVNGFCKGLRLVERKIGCPIGDLDIDEVSEDDSDVDVEN